MTRAFLRRMGATILISVLACGPVAAATFVYDLTVTESVDAIVDIGGVPTNLYDLPAVGSTGTLTIDLAVGPGNADPIPAEGLATSSLLMISAAFGNLTSNGLDPNFAVINPLPGRAQFRNGSSSSSTLVVDLAGSPATGTLAGSFSVSSASLPGVPATLGDVLAILSAPDAFAFMSFNGTAAGRFVSFAAEEVAPVPVVPLPAGGLLLLTGLGGLAAVRRRR